MKSCTPSGLLESCGVILGGLKKEQNGYGSSEKLVE
jgi:hypothetical protein